MVKTPTQIRRKARAPLETASKPCKQRSQADRFIPTRNTSDRDVASFKFLDGNVKAKSPAATSSSKKSAYRELLAEALLGDCSASRILTFRSKAPCPPPGLEVDTSLYSRNLGPSASQKLRRKLPRAPEKILDAPDMVDDYYLNLLDWSSSNVVAVALNSAVYLWNAVSGDTELLMQCQEADDYVTSVKWAVDGSHIAIGLSDANVQLWDANRTKQVRMLRGHGSRVGSLAWNRSTLSSGGRDSLILNHDVRKREHVTGTLRGHQQEVCGLAWSPSGDQLASGGNDNLLHIWSADSQRPRHCLSAHQAAVKAVSWCPWQSHLLASGGGSADRCIRFWNTATGTQLSSIDTHSQVCALQWSMHEREILSSHGFSQNQLCLWKYPTMAKIGEFNGHTSRVLHLSQSPDGTAVCSAAADETLRFWRVFGEPCKQKKAKEGSMPQSSLLRTIR